MVNRTLSGQNNDTRYYDVEYIRDADLSEEELKEKYTEIQSSFNSMQKYFTNLIFPEYILGYKDRLGYSGDRKIQLLKAGLADKSNIKYPLIASVHHTYHSNTYDSSTDIKAIPTTEKSAKTTESAQKLIDWGFSIAKADYYIKMMDSEATLIGPGYARAGYEFLDYEKQYNKGKNVNTFKYKRSNPRLDYIDVFKLYFDPHASDFYRAAKFYTQRMTWSKIEEMYEDFVKHVTPEQREEMAGDQKGSTKYWNNYDYSRVKQITGFENNVLNKVKNTAAGLNAEDFTNLAKSGDLTYSVDDVYKVDYKAELFEVVEYWEPSDNEDNMALIINGKMLYYGRSPYPFKGDPFVRTAFQEIPGSLFPKGIAQILRPMQIATDAFINDWIDTVNAMTNPSYIADKGVFGQKTPTVISLKPRRVYERVAGKTINPLLAVDPGAANNLLSGIQFFIGKAFELIGLNSYTQGGSGGIERTKGGVSSRVQVLKTALVPFFNNKNQALTEIGTRWLAMARVFMDPKFKVRVLDTDGNAKFEEIEINDLLNEFEFSYINQMKSIHVQEKRDAIIQGLQYTQDPEGQALLSKEYLKTLDITFMTLGEKKKIIDEQFDLEKHKQEKQAELAPQQGPGGQPPAPGGVPGQEIQQVPAPGIGGELEQEIGREQKNVLIQP